MVDKEMAFCLRNKNKKLPQPPFDLYSQTVPRGLLIMIMILKYICLKFKNINKNWIKIKFWLTS